MRWLALAALTAVLLIPTALAAAYVVATFEPTTALGIAFAVVAVWAVGVVLTDIASR